jgi:hypothetical protein
MMIKVSILEAFCYHKSMKPFRSRTLKKLDKARRKAKRKIVSMQSYAPFYFAELRVYIPSVMELIEDEDNRDECIKLLKLITAAEYGLMGLMFIAEVSLDADIHEISEDFDNDNPLFYDLIIQKIKNKEYLVQKVTAKN